MSEITSGDVIDAGIELLCYKKRRGRQMAIIPTPEESGRKILQIYNQDNIRSGEMMLMQAITVRWMKIGGKEEDLNSGLKWLSEQGYLEQKEGELQTAIFLTESGFAEL